MKWIKNLLATNYITKAGFLKGDGSRMETATLYVYSNGLCVVNWCCDNYSVTRRNEVQYDLDGPNHYGFTHFLASE